MFEIIKSTAFMATKSPAFDRFVKLLESVDNQKQGFLRVLTYHRIDDPTRLPWLDPGLISASPKDFAKQMEYLAAYYQIVSMSDVLAAVKTRNIKDLPPRALLITFDDGYCDFEEHAWPVLKRYKIPATLFVPTAYPDHPERTFWWNNIYKALHNTHHKGKLNTSIGTFFLSDADSRNHAYQRLKNYLKTLPHTEAILTVSELCDLLDVPPALINNILSWNTLRKLQQEGLTLGAHTRTHPLLNRVSLQKAREEVLCSLDDLQREIGSVLPIFAYPGGGFTNEVVSMLQREGFALAFTTERGINHIPHVDPLRIQRINVGGRTSLSVLRAQLLSWTIHLNRLFARLDPKI